MTLIAHGGVVISEGLFCVVYVAYPRAALPECMASRAYGSTVIQIGYVLLQTLVGSSVFRPPVIHGHHRLCGMDTTLPAPADGTRCSALLEPATSFGSMSGNSCDLPLTATWNIVLQCRRTSCRRSQVGFLGEFSLRHLRRLHV